MTTLDHQAFLDIPYAKYGDRELVLDVFLPLKPEGPLPVLVGISGGGWGPGLKTSIPARFAKRGFAIVGITYRGSAEVTAPGCVFDCKASIRWVRANAATYGFDPARVGVFGSSAGGHLVGLMGTSAGVKELEGDGGNPDFDSSVQAAYDVCGPCDFTRLVDPEYKAKNAYLYNIASAYLGGPIEERLDLARLVSPITHISKNTPPFMLMHGDVDELVPVEESLAFYDALKKAGVDVGLKIIKDSPHSIPWGDAEDEDVLSFFERIFMKKNA
ncbi:MAG: alpha/beta hydrolase [Chthoniobacterales bacterium]